MRELTFSDGVRWKADKGENTEKDSKIDSRVGKREQLRAVGLCAHLQPQELIGVEVHPDNHVEQVLLPSWLQPYRSVFDEPTKLDRDGRVRHQIKLQEGAVPCNRKPYRMAQDQKEALQKELSKFIKREWIRLSHSE